MQKVRAVLNTGEYFQGFQATKISTETMSIYRIDESSDTKAIGNQVTISVEHIKYVVFIMPQATT